MAYINNMVYASVMNASVLRACEGLIKGFVVC